MMLNKDEVVKKLNTFKDDLNGLREQYNGSLENIGEVLSETIPERYYHIRDKLHEVDSSFTNTIDKINNCINEINKGVSFISLEKLLEEFKINNNKKYLYEIIKGKNRRWKFIVYPINDKSISIIFLLDFKNDCIKISIKYLRYDTYIPETEFALLISHPQKGLISIQVYSDYKDHLMYKFIDQIKDKSSDVLIKLRDIFIDINNDIDVVEKYFKINDFYYGKTKPSENDLYEACAINFIRLFGGKIEYFKPPLISKNTNNMALICEINNNIKELMKYIHDDSDKIVEYSFGAVDIENSNLSNNIFFCNYEGESKFVFKINKYHIGIFDIDDNMIGTIEYSEKLGGIYSFFPIKYLSIELSDLYRFISLDYTKALINLNTILENAYEYGAEWYEYLISQLRIFSFTCMEDDRLGWIKMLQRLSELKF